MYIALSYYVKVAWLFADNNKYALEEMIRLTDDVDENSINSLNSLILMPNFITTLTNDNKHRIISNWSFPVPDLYIMNSALKLIEYTYFSVDAKYRTGILEIVKEMNLEFEGISGDVNDLAILYDKFDKKYVNILGAI